MNRRCDCGCKRHTQGEWLSARLGSFWFSPLCNIRLGDALRAAGFNYYAPIEDQPLTVLTGGDPARECG